MTCLSVSKLCTQCVLVWSSAGVLTRQCWMLQKVSGGCRARLEDKELLVTESSTEYNNVIDSAFRR